MKDEILINTIKKIISNIHLCKNNVQKREHVLNLLKILDINDYIIKNNNEDIISNNMINILSLFENPSIITDDNLIIVCSSTYNNSLKLVSNNGNLILQNIYEKDRLHYILDRIEISFDGEIKSLETSYSLLKKDNITTERGIYRHSTYNINGLEMSYKTIFTENKKNIKQLNNKVIQEELKNDTVLNNINIDMPKYLHNLNEYNNILGEEMLIRHNLDEIEYDFQSKDNKKHGFILPIERNIYRCKDINDKIYPTENDYNYEKEKLILSGEYREAIDNLDNDTIKEQFSVLLQK